MTHFHSLSRARALASRFLGAVPLVAWALAASGCAQILGLGDYEEGAGGSASSSTASGSSTATASVSGSVSGSTSSDASGSGTGGSGGSGATCTTQGSLLDVFTGSNIDSQRVATAFDATNHVTLAAISRNGSGMTGIEVVGIRDNGQVLAPASYEVVSGGATVDALVVTGGAVIAYVRAGNQLGEVHFAYSNGQFSGAPVFVAYTDVPDVACGAMGSINRFMFQRPLDPANPRWVAICRHSSLPYEKVYVGGISTSSFVSQEAIDEPADRLDSYFALGGGKEILFAGGDPSPLGAAFRFGSTPGELAEKHTMIAEADPDRETVNLSDVPDGQGGIRVFLATLDSTSIIPAHIYVTQAAGDNLAQLATQPTPGLALVTDPTGTSDLAGFSPIVVTTGRLAGAGATVDRKSVIFTLMTSEGALLTRTTVRQADAGLSIDNATSLSTSGPSYLVLWNEGNQTSQTIHAQALLCVGG